MGTFADIDLWSCTTHHLYNRLHGEQDEAVSPMAGVMTIYAAPKELRSCMTARLCL